MARKNKDELLELEVQRLRTTIERYEAAMRGAIKLIEEYSELYGPGTAPGYAVRRLHSVML